MNRLLKSRIVRVTCPVVAPPPEEPALSLPKGPALPAPEGSAAEGTVPEASKARSLRPGRICGTERPALREAKGSEACRLRPERICRVEGARPPHSRRHARLCTICCHPDRDAIEEDFIHWHSPSDIAIDYNLPDRSSIYRHAHATGLFARRSRNLRFVLERLLERVDKVKVTAHAVVRAVRAYTRINDKGEWIDPPTRIIVSSVSPPAAPALPDCTDRHKRVPGKATGRSVLIATRGHSRDEPTR